MKACFQTDGKCEGKYSALTPTLTTESPINRAFQANCEGVRVEKEKKFFLFFRSIRVKEIQLNKGYALN